MVADVFVSVILYLESLDLHMLVTSRDDVFGGLRVKLHYSLSVATNQEEISVIKAENLLNTEDRRWREIVQL